MRYPLKALRERIRSARRQHDRKRFRNGSFRAHVETLEDRRLLAGDFNPTVLLGFYGVPENSPVGTLVGTVAATQHPQGEGDLVYEITGGNADPDNDGTPAFALDATNGQITVNDQGDMDFETMRIFELFVTVKDDTGCTEERQLIALSDTPENSPPVIDVPEEINLPENSANGTVVATITASDPEGDSLVFSLPGGGNVDVDGDETLPFAIDANTGVVTVADTGDIDFEGGAPNPLFPLVVRVTDDGQGEFFTDLTIDINVTDQNDAPVVPDQSFTLPENTGNSTVVGVLAASDQDAGQSITFSLNPNAAHDLDNDGVQPVAIAADGTVTVADSHDLNFELMESFEISFTVTDDNTDPGDPDPISNPASTTTTFTLDLLNVIENLHPLVLDQVFEVSENAALDFVIGTVEAIDTDDPPDALSYSIVSFVGDVDLNDNDIQPIGIDPASGELTVTDPADLLNGNQPIVFTVEVKDDGEDMLSDRATITVNVLDVNDEPVAEDQTLAVAEGSPGGAIVGQIVASDPNDDTLTYTFVGPGDTTTFAINAATGLVTVADPAPLDHEVNPIITTNVMIEDNGIPSKSVTIEVDIHVQNLTENNPPEVEDATFPPGEGQTFAENREVGFEIGTITFTDPVFPGQIPATQTGTFSITGGNPGDAFAIDPVTGVITVANQFAMDFEEQPTFSLEVTVTDDGEGPLSGTAIATINLRDSNDPPEIAPDQLGIIDEDAAPGAAVSEVPFLNDFFLTWSDQDDGDTSTFEILSQTAVSNGVETDVSAAGEELGAFTIDASTGQFFTGNEALYDFDALVNLDGWDPETELPTVVVDIVVQATDGEGAVSAPETVMIVIRNIDDNSAPELGTQQGFSFDLENDVAGFDPLSDSDVVGDCVAQLSPDHNSLAFLGCGSDSSEDGTASIHVDSPTGDALVTDIPVIAGDMPLFVWNQLTQSPNPLFGEEDEPEFLDTPFDADALAELLEDNTLFLVFNLPAGAIGGQLRSDPNGTDAFVVDENADGLDNVAVGDLVGQLTADDAEGYALTFEILSGNPNLDGDEESAYAIDDTGRITVNDPDDLDADVMPQSTLAVAVTDQPLIPDFEAGHTSFVFRETAQTTTATVEINLRNLNDAPSMMPAQQFGSVVENSLFPGLTLVGDPIQAFDGDGDELTFSITGQTPSGEGIGDDLFAINPTSGQITVNGPIDYEVTTDFFLDIEVTDGQEVAHGIFLALVLNAPENEAPETPDQLNNADPILGGLDFDLNREQTVPEIDEDDHPGSSGSCNYTFEPLGEWGYGSFSINCTHDVVNPTAAHIHLGAADATGPVVVGFEDGTSPLSLSFDQTFSSDELADFQAFADALLAGDLYVNVHSEAHGPGEIRGQIPAPDQNQLVIHEHTAANPLANMDPIGLYLGASDPDLPLTFAITGGNFNTDGDTEMALGIDEDTGLIYVNDPGDFDFERVGKAILDITVTDSPQSDAPLSSTGRQMIYIDDLNDAPNFGPLFSIFSPLNKLQTTVNGVDVDRNQDFVDSIFSVLGIETEGLTPDPIDPAEIASLGLFVDGSLFPNFFGGGEKWLRGAPAGPGLVMDWYFILPTGEFVRWDEGPGTLTGESLGFFGIEAWADPVGEIVDAAAPEDYPLPSEVDLVIDESPEATGFGLGDTDPNTFTITRESGAGTALVTLQVCDADDPTLCDTEVLQVGYGENLPPTLTPIGDQTSAAGAATIVVPLSATDPNPGANLEFSVELTTVEYDLHRQFGFFIDGTDFQDALGANERWIKDSAGDWFFVLPTNELFRWDRSATATGTLVAQLNAGVYDDLNLLTSPANDVPATAEIVDDVLTITKDAGFTGFFNAEVGVFDGADTVREKFLVTFV